MLAAILIIIGIVAVVFFLRRGSGSHGGDGYVGQGGCGGASAGAAHQGSSDHVHGGGPVDAGSDQGTAQPRRHQGC